MPGPIFLHFQTYSRKPNPAGNSAPQIIGEALREAEFSHHITDPKEPRVILGNPRTFADDHAAHIADRATEVKRKGKVHKKAIRQDRHTLATAVASYPLTGDQIAEGGDKARRAYQEWERRTVAWMRDRYGDQLRVVLAHEDEPHPHLHFWMLPDDPDARADTLHPGKVAQRIAEGVERAAGATDRQAVKAGNIAYKEAMRETLDQYLHDVGAPLGMTRDGPKRLRETRAVWKARKEEAARQARSLRRAEEAERLAQAAEKRGRDAAAATLAHAEAVAASAQALAREMEAGTLILGGDGKVYGADVDALRPGAKVLGNAMKAAAKAQTIMNERGAFLDGVRSLWHEIRGAIPSVRAILQRQDARPEERATAKAARREIVKTLPRLRAAILGTLPGTSSPPEQPRQDAAPDGLDGPGM